MNFKGNSCVRKCPDLGLNVDLVNLRKCQDLGLDVLTSLSLGQYIKAEV